MRAVVSLALAALVGLTAACQPAPPEPKATRAQAARLVLATYDQQAMHLQPVEPSTLEDVPGVAPMDVPRCTRATSLQPQGGLLAVITVEPACDASGSAVIRMLDLGSWQWRSEVALPQDEQTSVRPASLLAWSPDGAWLYALTSTQGSQRRLWRIDVSGATPPTSVTIEGVPQRLDVAPNGTGVLVLVVLTRDGTSFGDVVPGSTLLNIFDPTTLAVRTHVPLPNVKVVPPRRDTRPLRPAVALAPDGSRYYVAHADEPVLDVVDLRAPKLERLERSVPLRATPNMNASTSAWLAVSPDGGQLRTWRGAANPLDDVGLQTIDTHTWQVTTVDALAMRLWGTFDGLWLVRLDPPPERVRANWRRGDGFRLSVADASGQEAALLLPDQAPYALGQYGADRLYVEYGDPWTLVAYEVGTWHELARREVPPGAWLVTQSALW